MIVNVIILQRMRGGYSMGKQALSRLKVLDLSWNIAGPYCTKLLADSGAEVIKVERPSMGDPSRHEGPYPNDEKNIEASGLFAYLNNNKKSITLNLKSEAGKEAIKALVKEADVLVENFSPGVMDGLGLGYESLKEINPKLIMTSISNFGQTGKFRDHHATELVMQAMSGWVTSIGEVGRPPLRAGGQLRLLEYIAGTFAGVSTLTAVLQRRRTKVGKHIDVSIAECGLLQRSYPTVQDSFPFSPHKTNKRFVMTPSVEKCKDGYIGITLLTGKHWQDFCAMTEMYDWIDDPRFTTLHNRLQHKNEFQERLDEWLMHHTREEIMELGTEWRVPVIPVPTLEEMLDFPHYKEREFFVTLNQPQMGEVIQPGAPFRMSETPWKINNLAPSLGEHNEHVFVNLLGYSNIKMEELSKQGVI